jgi:CheY-like chemotaxis protein
MDRSGRSGDEQHSAMLIDNDSSTFPLHLRALHSLGYQVTKVTDPALALNVAKQSAPRIIFMSIGVLGTGGAAFLQGLRSYDGTRHIPVRILSNRKDRWLESKGLRRVGRELL